MVFFFVRAVRRTAVAGTGLVTGTERRQIAEPPEQLFDRPDLPTLRDLSIAIEHTTSNMPDMNLRTDVQHDCPPRSVKSDCEPRFTPRSTVPSRTGFE